VSDVAERFGENLARCRRRVRLSQEMVAVRAGLHRTEIGHLENGRRLPRIDTAMKLAAAVEAQIGELVEGINWVSGDCRTGAFVLDSKRRPSIRRQPGE
jgi:DNA-binding XRE family transcriptional regulator